MIHRRSLITGIGAALAMPAIVRADGIMRVRPAMQYIPLITAELPEGSYTMNEHVLVHRTVWNKHKLISITMFGGYDQEIGVDKRLSQMRGAAIDYVLAI